MSEEQRKGLVTDIALIAGPSIGAATAWALGEYGPSADTQASDPAPPEVVLPPGVDKD